MNIVFLSRLQFALTIMFHYLFPPLTIGMGMVLVYLDFKWLRTGQRIYEQAAKFWTKIFALNFAIGVATGIVMEFEFGTNWATYSRFVGDVFGSALAAEGIFAFFLESGFLAVLVFGWDRVSRPMHFFATVMVALGSIFSSIWIVVANCWQQTPAGSHIVPMLRDGLPWIVDGVPIMRAEITDFWAMVFNPSTVHRLIHVWLSAFIMGGCFVLSISAWYLLHNKHVEFARRSFRGALLVATLSSVLIGFSGHLQARSVYQHQPAKLAAFEGLFHTTPAGAPMTLFGWPDDRTQSLRHAISIPGVLSVLLHDDFKTPVLGLDAFRPADRPKTVIPFFSYHLMIGVGVMLLGLTLYGSYRLWRGTLFDSRWLMWAFVLSVVPAVLGNQSGWVSAETGRQPWIVHPTLERSPDGTPSRDADGYIQYRTVTNALGQTTTAGLRTTDAVSKAIRSSQVLSSIIMFGLLYSLLGGLWLFVLHQKIQHGPEAEDAHPTSPHAGPRADPHPVLSAAARHPGEGLVDTDPEGAR